MVIRKRREGMMIRQKKRKVFEGALQLEEERCIDQKQEEGKDTEERKKKLSPIGCYMALINHQ